MGYKSYAQQKAVWADRKDGGKGHPNKKKGSPAHMSRDLSYGGPVIDQMGNALSHMGAHKVLKHMKSK